MKLYNFTITIEESIDNLDVLDAFYGKLQDASVASGDGRTYIHFDREADSLDDALHSAIADLLSEGWHVRKISVEPDCVRPLSTP